MHNGWLALFSFSIVDFLSQETQMKRSKLTLQENVSRHELLAEESSWCFVLSNVRMRTQLENIPLLQCRAGVKQSYIKDKLYISHPLTFKLSSLIY